MKIKHSTVSASYVHPRRTLVIYEQQKTLWFLTSSKEAKKKALCFCSRKFKSNLLLKEMKLLLLSYFRAQSDCSKKSPSLSCMPPLIFMKIHKWLTMTLHQPGNNSKLVGNYIIAWYCQTHRLYQVFFAYELLKATKKMIMVYENFNLIPNTQFFQLNLRR